MVVKNQGHSTRSIPVERFYRRKRCTIPADFVLIIDYTGGLFHKCFYFRVGTWPRHIDSPASLIGDEIKGIALRVAIEIAPRIAEMMAKERGKDEVWKTEQINIFRNMAGQYLPV